MSPVRKLADLVELQRGTTYKSALLGLPGPVLLGLASIARDGGFRDDSLRTYGGESAEKLLLGPGDLYVSLKDVTQSGDLLGSVARVPSRIAVGRLTQDTVKLVLRSEARNSAAFLYWVLRAPEYRAYCRARAIGTTNLSLSREDFLAFEIPEPTPERLRIVQLLDAIEAKSELNRRMNETLEGLARGMFKSWFVDFDPVLAKVRGHAPIGIDAPTASMFPNTVDESSGGLLPRGWRRVPLGEVLELKRGYDLPNADRRVGGVPIISSSGPSGFHDTAPVRGPGVVTGRYGTIGKVFLVWEDYWPLNTALYVRDFKGMDPLFGLYLLRGLDFEKFSDKGAVPGINRNHVHTEPVCIAPEVLQQRFADLVRPWLMLVRRNEKESITLANVRDMLLPKLASGELRIRDAARAIEAVA